MPRKRMLRRGLKTRSCRPSGRRRTLAPTLFEPAHSPVACTSVSRGTYANSVPKRKAVARRTDLARSRGTPVVPHSEDSDPLVGRRDRHSPPLYRLADRPGKLVGRLAGERGLHDSDRAVTKPRERDPPGGVERAVVGGPDKPYDLASGRSPDDVSLVWHLASEIAPLTQILFERRDRRRVARGIGDQPQDERDAVPDTFCRQRETGLGVLDRERRVVGECTAVDPRIHPMQSCSMPRLSLVDRPARRIQAGVFRQWSRVEVEAADPRSAYHVGTEYEQRMDVQEEIDLEVAERGTEGAAPELRRRPHVEPQPGRRRCDGRSARAVPVCSCDDGRYLGRLRGSVKRLENLGSGRLLADHDDTQLTGSRHAVSRTCARSALGGGRSP